MLLPIQIVRTTLYGATMLAALRSNRSISLGSLRRLSTTVPFAYQELFDVGEDKTTPYKKLTSDYVSTFTVRRVSHKYHDHHH